MTYPGGKGGSGVAQALINLMPPHEIYVEAFLGSGAVLRAKRPARSHTIGIDVDRAALDLTMSAIAGTTWKVTMGDPATSELTRAAGNAGNDDGVPRSTIASADDSAGGIAVSNDADRRTSPELTLLQTDSIEWLQKIGRLLPASTLVYCDPPYVHSTRKQVRPIYDHEMSDADHVKLLTALKSLNCMVMVSGYYSDLYAGELHSWCTATFTTTVRSGAQVTEHVWFNYLRPIELHDYRYLGKNFRERERIKRKMGRWKERLRRMPDLERQALLWAMREFYASIA
jgi:DNA adenine methylase